MLPFATLNDTLRALPGYRTSGHPRAVDAASARRRNQGLTSGFLAYPRKGLAAEGTFHAASMGKFFPDPPLS